MNLAKSSINPGVAMAAIRRIDGLPSSIDVIKPIQVAGPGTEEQGQEEIDQDCARALRGSGVLFPLRVGPGRW